MENEVIILSEDPQASARMAGLRYVSDEEPGIRRKRWGRGFTYVDPQGQHITDDRRQRFEQLAIPPAWSDVWICPDEKGHIQATGRDAKGRKQYIYHPQWQEIRSETKFNRLLLFGDSLPQLRQQVDEDLRRHGMPRERVLAAVVRLLQETLIRVGNSEYMRENDSYGLTTLRMKHTEVNSRTVQFEFKGKSGKYQQLVVSDPRVARVVQQLQELPGYELFQYVDDEGRRRTVDSDDVNEYVRQATGRDFTAKEFRTWGATVAGVRCLRELGAPVEDANVASMYERVAEQLGNTVAVCRQYYVHPAVVRAYKENAFFEGCDEEEEYAGREWLSEHERFTLRLLRRALSEGM